MEPTPEEAAEGSILIKVLAAVLQRLVNSNALIAKSDPGQLTKFHALKAPGIGVEAYLERVQKYASCSNQCFILALIYIDRLIERNNFLLTDLNVHRVVITAILLSAKFFDDAYYNNAYYAKVGGVLISELNGLEVDFLFRINFSLHVSPILFEKYKAELVAHSINSGLVVNYLSSSVSPHIPEKESESTISSSSSMMAKSELSQRHHLEQHKQIQQQFPFPIENAMKTTCLQTATSIPNQIPETTTSFCHNSRMSAPKQVTPSPSLSSQNRTDMLNGNGNKGIATNPNHSSNESSIVRAQQQHVDELNTSVSVISALSQSKSSNSDKTYSQQHHQSILLQRANSLPFVSSGRCIDHAFKLPYSAPPMPTTVPHVLTAVDQERYQLMMNQLFPIKNTLVHHNHEVAGTSSTSDFFHHQHHVNAAAAVAGLVGHHHHGARASHHPSIQGSGLA